MFKYMYVNKFKWGKKVEIEWQHHLFKLVLPLEYCLDITALVDWA